MSETEWIVVYKKGVPLSAAKSILISEKVSYHEGSDSSRGKVYFYKTGPKFVVKVPKETEHLFISFMQKKAEVYEVYHPEWDMCKD